MSQTKIKNKTNQHVPVLLREVIDSLSPNLGESYLDLTAGYGGHAREVLDITQGRATLVDRDENAIQNLRAIFGDSPAVTLLHQSFLHACEMLAAENKQYDMILADLGVSSPHLDNAERGFSLKNEGPLDMRMDSSQELTAETVVNSYDEQSLIRVLREYGEEPKAKTMAKSIIAARPIQSTTELAAVAKKVWPGYSKVHPATRLFQAVRIEVNDELGQLERALPLLKKLLAPGGRVVIITFHSLEDRIVKRFFKQLVGDRYDAEFEELNKRPITASADELDINPRSRSAKIRAYRKRK
ncbi:16S rRNA (cytosine(1402)-N(4))-methyltransferase RsmH [Candidatus Saccharibacteria bacterium]|nr:16S rRNA (cytosine(1402)-N(4))-methyltransferase RsmH [Candidatus Saccharibacteria bacterium]